MRGEWELWLRGRGVVVDGSRGCKGMGLPAPWPPSTLAKKAGLSVPWVRIPLLHRALMLKIGVGGEVQCTGHSIWLLWYPPPPPL